MRALDAGVNYIDTAHTYSKGMAHAALKLAFSQTKMPYCVTVKSKLDIDRDADGARRRVETSLVEMGIEHASHFLCWSIMSYAEFGEITRRGGIYDGAERLRTEGIIDHICFSVHAPVPDAIRMLASGAFEGVTISFSLLNSGVMLPVLKKADELGIGVTAMNPLGGGIIPQNREYFGFARARGESTTQAALRYAAAHPVIKAVIAGPASVEELDESIAAFTQKNLEPEDTRVGRVNAFMRELEDFCTGCGYCAGCPNGIPISEIMQSRNTLQFKNTKTNNREDSELLRNIQLFRKLSMDFAYMPEIPENPCTRCGRCEKKCTQNLRIMDMLDDTYRRMRETNFSHRGRRERLEKLLRGRKKVGFYSAGGYMTFVLEQYRKLIGEPEFEITMFDSNPAMWGQTVAGQTVRPPAEIPTAAPEAILIGNYNYEREIFDDLIQFADNGIEILKLHMPGEVPWVY